MQRTLDKTKVTCIRWIPGSSHAFIASHASGQLYVYDMDVSSIVTLTSSGAMPHYQVIARGDAFTVYACRAKTVCNPLQRWTVGAGPINEFAFSPCGQYLAVVSADGYLRVFVYRTVEVVGLMRSYFGGLLCVAWSPDGRYIATGGEDDLITLWSFAERRVVCRGRGHRSWVGGVAFDPYAASVGPDFTDFCGSEDEICRPPPDFPQMPTTNCDDSPSSGHTHEVQSYRLGSIGHDAMLCLWDITDEVLWRPVSRTRTSTVVSHSETDTAQNCIANTSDSAAGGGDTKTVTNCVGTASTNVVQKFATLALGDRPVKEKQRRSASGAGSSEHRWHFSLASRSSDSKIQLLKAAAAAAGTGGRGQHMVDDAVRLLGTPTCPRLTDVPMLVPLVGKRVAHERLTALVFREDCLVTSCYEGVIYTWARPVPPSYTVSPQKNSEVLSNQNQFSFSCHLIVVVVGLLVGDKSDEGTRTGYINNNLYFSPCCNSSALVVDSYHLLNT